MPTASEELRNFARKHFGSLDCGAVEDVLKRNGFWLTSEFTWKRTRPPNEFEWNCINFLIEEWDYNGYED